MLTSTPRAGRVDVTGTTVSVAFNCQIERAADIRVRFITTLAPDPDWMDAALFAVTGGQTPSGGTIAFSPSLSGSGVVEWERVTATTQDTRLSDADRFQLAAIEGGLDRAMMRLQELEERGDRAIVFPRGAGVEVRLPAAVLSLQRFLVVGPDGVDYADGVAEVPVSGDIAPLLQGTVDDMRKQLGGKVVPIEAYGNPLTWTGALNTAAAEVAAAGGGCISFYGYKEYQFLTEPDAIPDGVLLLGVPNFTRPKMPAGNVTCRLFKFLGALGAAFTLAANAANGAEVISLVGVGLDLAVDEIIRIQKTPGAPITLGKYTQPVRVEQLVESGGNTLVTLGDRLEFAVQTSDTYTVRACDTHKGGGAYGFIFDGSDNLSADCVGIWGNVVEGMFFDHIGGENMKGVDPMNGSTVASVISLYTAFDIRGLNDIWAYKSGSGAMCAIQFREMGPCQYGQVDVEACFGFGVGWYDAVEQSVLGLRENGSYGRSGKAQCVLGFYLGRGRSAKARFTAIAFTEGTRAHVNSLSYHPTDLQYFGVVSLTRTGNVATIVFNEPLYIYDTGHQVLIAGATGTDAATFNGLLTLTRVSGNTYTYPSVGVNEVAGGAIVANLNRSPSCWVNDTGCHVVIDNLDLRGVTNPSGDVHSGLTDTVIIGRLRTEGGFTPTYGGTAGAAANGTGRHIFDANGVFSVPGALEVINGQAKFTRASGSPLLTVSADFSYPVATAVSGASEITGWRAASRDSGGIQRSLTLQNVAGLARIICEVERIEFWAANAERARVPAAGGFQVGSHIALSVGGDPCLRGYTAAQLGDATHAINTTDKLIHKVVKDTTNNRMVSARGTTTTSAWDGDGATITPV